MTPDTDGWSRGILGSRSASLEEWDVARTVDAEEQTVEIKPPVRQVKPEEQLLMRIRAATLYQGTVTEAEDLLDRLAERESPPATSP